MNLFKSLFNSILVSIGQREQDLSMKPIKPEDLQKKLRKGKVQFFFKKINGDLRLAHGTLKMKYVPKEHHPKGVREPSPKVVNFFDLTKSQWRSVSVNEEIFIQPK